jgi:NADPH:quinone reductase-like Zn-dependent oxidoreductase
MDGLLTTLDTVRSKPDQPLTLGYCNVGTAVAVGPGVTGFALGGRVVSNGPRTEEIAVPRISARASRNRSSMWSPSPQGGGLPTLHWASVAP